MGEGTRMLRSLMVGSLTAAVALGALADAGYETIEETDGLRIERRAGRVSAVDAVRISGRIAAPVAVVVDLVWSGQHEQDLVPHLVDWRTLASEADTRVMLGRLDFPLLSDRVYVTRIERHIDSSSGAVELRFSLATEHLTPERLELLAQHAIPMAALEGRWRFELIDDGRATAFVYACEADPGGAVPGWLASRLQRDSAIALVRGMAALAEAVARQPATPAVEPGR